jgi:hypothetical protein
VTEWWELLGILTIDPGMSMKTKGEVKKSWSRDWLAQTFFFNVCDAPQAQACGIAVDALLGPFGTSQTHTLGLRQPKGREN